MRADLASGAWVELRELSDLNAKDKLVMQRSVKLPFDIGQQNTATQMMMSAGVVTVQTHAVMARVITAWSFDLRKPSEDTSRTDDGDPAYEESILMLPIDDYNEIEELIEPYAEKLRGGGPKSAAKITSNSNGSSRAKAPSTRRT